MFNMWKLWEGLNKVVVRNTSNFIKPEKLNKVQKEHRLPQLLHIVLPKQFEHKIAVIAINDPRQGLDHIRLRHPEILTDKSKTPRITVEMAKLGTIIKGTTQSAREQRHYKKLLQKMNEKLFKEHYNANIELFKELQDNMKAQHFISKSITRKQQEIDSHKSFWYCLNKTTGNEVLVVCFGTQNEESNLLRIITAYKISEQKMEKIKLES